MNKTDIEKEVRYIHEQYEKENGKFIKPSFRYLLEVLSCFGGHDGDYYVSNDLAEIQSKALDFTNFGDRVVIFEIISTKDGYVGEDRYETTFEGKILKEVHRPVYSRPMHIAWHTRGECLNEICRTN